MEYNYISRHDRDRNFCQKRSGSLLQCYFSVNILSHFTLAYFPASKQWDQRDNSGLKSVMKIRDDKFKYWSVSTPLWNIGITVVADILWWKAAMQNLDKHESAPYQTVLILIYSSVL